MIFTFKFILFLGNSLLKIVLRLVYLIISLFLELN